MKEAVIQRDIVAFLRSIGCAVYVTSQGYRKEPGGTRMTPGLPDLFVVGRDGKWTWAEVKNERGQLTLPQQAFRCICVDAGLPWELWREPADAFDWASRVGLVTPA